MNKKKELNLRELAKFAEWKFVPENICFSDIEQIKSVYDLLINRTVNSSDDLEKWLLDRSEFEAAFNQFGSILYIEMTCQTDNKEKADAYTEFISKIAPAVQPLDDQLNKKFIAEYDKHGLDEERYSQYIRDTRTNLELFFEENIPLQTQENLLSQEYQKICGAMSVTFEGKEHTLPEMSKYLLELDRPRRESAWKAIAERRLQDKDKLESLYEEMLSLRNQIARNAGFENYMLYKFKSLHRFDYNPEDCKAFHNAVEKVAMPALEKILITRLQQMGLDNLRPWDTAVDPLGREALKPFEEVEDLIQGCSKIFSNLDEELGSQFSKMSEMGLLDLESRKGKAPGGYQSALSDARVPFIFMNAVGLDGDVKTLLHEGGHAFHACACANEPLLYYRHAPIEFSEVASMSMELLGGEYLSAFYSSDHAKRANIKHLEGVVSLLAWVATIDAFQHWIYENPEHSREERREAWLSVAKRFSSETLDWSGLEDVESYIWHRQLHLFLVPFYYVEYAIAQLGALQIWVNSKNDKPKAIQSYKNALALGGSKELPKLFQTAGIKFDFTENTIAPLLKTVSTELEKLNTIANL